MIQKLFNWIFSKQLRLLQDQLDEASRLCNRLEEQRCKFDIVLSGVEASVDVVYPARGGRSWAVISLQGQSNDFIRFVDLIDRDIRYIADFLRQFENHKVDADPQSTQFLKIRRK